MDRAYTDVHVVPHFRRWAVRRLAGNPSSETFRTQDEAMDRALELAREEGGEVVIHNRKGERVKPEAA